MNSIVPPDWARIALAAGLPDVPRETRDRLQNYVNMLMQWQKRINLIGSGSSATIWERHIVDCAQLNRFGLEANTWLDIGSGAGLPGLVIAILRQPSSWLTMTLVESDARKAAFIREAARQLGISVRVENKRVEELLLDEAQRSEVVSARALAPLGPLVNLVMPLLTTGCMGIFPKGQNVDSEWMGLDVSHLIIEQWPSMTQSGACIITVKARN